LKLPSSLQRNNVTDNHHTQAGDSASSNTRQSSENIKHWGIARNTAHQIRKREQSQGTQVNLLSAKDIRKPSIEYLKSGVSNQSRSACPGHGVGGVQVVGDSGEQLRDAILIDEHDEQGEREKGECKNELFGGK